MQRIKNFIADKRGAVAIIFSLSLVPLLGITFLAVEASNVNRIIRKVQNTQDLATLAFAEQVQVESSESTQLRLRAAITLAQLELGSPFEIKNISTWTDKTNKIWVETYINIISQSPSSFLSKYFGFQSSLDNIKISTTVDIAQPYVEIAIVASQSNSMGRTVYDLRLRDDNYKDLKDLTAGLLNRIKHNTAKSDVPDRVRVGLVPYTETVQVGEEYAREPWVTNKDTGLKFWETGLSVLDDYRVARYMDAKERNGFFKGPLAKWLRKEWHEFKEMFDWSGCVTDRREKYRSPVDYSFNYRPAHAVVCGDRFETPDKIEPLRADYDVLKSRVDDKFRAGSANMYTGLSWGYTLLSPDAPLPFLKTQSANTTKEVERYIILMSDGHFNVSRYDISYLFNGDNELTKDQEDRDKKLQELCSSIKAKGVKIVSVYFRSLHILNVYEKRKKRRMQGCASPEGGSADTYFYEVRDAPSLRDAFEKIATRRYYPRLMN
jgi:Putative Flp pilus-assembly TadE/G-like